MNTRCIVLGLGCLLLVAPAQYGGSDAKPPVVEVALPLAREVTDYEVFAGRIEAAERVDLRARVTGYVTKVHFKPGENVSKGQVLFEIDPRPYQAALDLAEAQLLLADAKLKRSGAEDRAELEAGRRIAVAGIELARLNVDFTKVSAPIEGKISAPALTAGNLAKADETRLASIDSVNSARVVFNVYEGTVLALRDLMKERKAKKTSVRISMGRSDDKDFPHSGTLDLGDLRIDVKTGMILCRAVFPNADGTLMPGMSARVRLATSALAVDGRAIRDAIVNGISYVLVVNEKNIVEKREVQIALQQGLWAIKSGLKAEDWVVVKGAEGLKVGMTVQPKRVVMRDPSVAPPKKLPEKETPAEEKAASAKLRDLMKERHAVLTQAADVFRMQYQAGRVPFSAVVQARQAVIDAGLDLCETHAERIDLLRTNVKLAEEMHKITQARRKAALNGEAEALQAQAMLLDVHIRLLREEEKAKAGR